MILTAPRSGSSIVAGLFALHGVWVGNTAPVDESNPKGNFEGTAVGGVLDDLYGPLATRGKEAVANRAAALSIAEAIRTDGYRSGPWLWKGSAMYWRAFVDLDPYWITVRRPRAAVLKSNEAVARLGHSPFSPLLEHIRVLDYLETVGATRIDSVKLIAHDFRQIRHAFEVCGLVFDETIARQWIDPELWHY